jgi:hypothetical protein
MCHKLCSGAASALAQGSLTMWLRLKFGLLSFKKLDILIGFSSSKRNDTGTAP